MIDETKDTETVDNENQGEAVPEAEPERVIVFEEAIEAILFAAGHPISYATLARVFDTTPAKIKEKVMDYADKYNSSAIPRGVILLTYADACQLSTKKYYLPEIRDAVASIKQLEIINFASEPMPETATLN